MNRKRVAFVTIGQAPRDDLMPEILAQIGDGIEATEIGLLDGLSREEIAAHSPSDDGDRLVSRLTDGTEVLLDKSWVEGRLQEAVAEVDRGGFHLIVLLCTGNFPNLHSKTLLVESGRVVDHMVDALSADGRTVGLMVPNEAQVGDFARSAPGAPATVASHASPYTNRRFAEATRDLAPADFIVMHCMGYDLAMRAQVAELSGKPVLLSRAVVASAVMQLV